MNDELNIPVQFKGTKCIFLSLVPTCAELETCQHFYMKSNNKWNPDYFNLLELRKISQLYKNDTRNIYQTKHDTVYPYQIPTSNHVHDMYSYHEPYSEKAISLEISSSFIQLKDLCIAQINAKMTETTQNEIRSSIIPLRRRYCYDQMYNLKILQGCFEIKTLFADITS